MAFIIYLAQTDNISVMTGWIAVKFGADIHHSQRMYLTLTQFDDPLTEPLRWL